MSRLQEIKTRTDSVRGTKKITRAMYLISASKSQKAKAQLEHTLPYFIHVSTTLAEILSARLPMDTYFIGHKKRNEGKGNLYVVLSGDKGMAGGYNHNLINFLHARTDKNTATLAVAGLLGRGQIAREGFATIKEFRYPVMNPSVYRAREIAEFIIEQYLAHKYYEVHIVYTEMMSPLKQEPVMARLLPLRPEEFAQIEGVKLEPSAYHLIKYEPSARDVFDHLVPHYLKGVIYSAFVEAFTSEQHARMYAMDNATKSADDMISGLSLKYNRARQAMITQEINEIVGGIPNE